MKFFYTISLCLFSCFLLQAQSTESALAYLDDLTEGQENISEQLMRYISASTHSKSARTIELRRNNLIEATKKMKYNAEQATAYEGNSNLRDAMLAYYDLCLETLTNDYKEIAELKEGANSNYELMKALLQAEEDAEDDLDEAHQVLDEQIEQFASTYQIELVQQKNSLSEMISQSNMVTEYYNDIFLPMFKVNLQNVHLKEMLSTNNIDKIEEARKLTIEYADEARAEIQKMEAFNGDTQLLEAAMKRINYYIEEANTMGLNSIELVKLTNQLEEKKNHLEGVKAKDRTKKMVDDYNALVDEVNELSQKMNAYAQQFNTVGQREMQQWEQMVQQFRKRHIPRYGLLEQST